jgi:predicted secreted protein
MNRFFIFYICTCFCFLNSCAGSKLMITESDIEKVPIVKVNDLVNIKLESQPGTGFSWEIQSTKGFDIKGKPEQISSAKGMPGGKEYQLFTIKAKDAGDGEIILIYNQQWKKEDKPAKIIKLKFLIK